MTVERPKPDNHPFEKAFSALNTELLIEEMMLAAESTGIRQSSIASMEQGYNERKQNFLSTLKTGEIALYNRLVDLAREQVDSAQLSLKLTLMGLTEEHAGQVVASVELHKRVMDILSKPALVRAVELKFTNPY